MLLNIVTGRNAPKQRREDILVLVSSMRSVQVNGANFVFTDGNAYPDYTLYSNQIQDLDNFIPWDLLQKRDFSYDPENPDKMMKYMAEALVHHHLPASALLGIGTYTDEMRATVETQVAAHQLPLKVVTRPNWFFR